MSILKLLALFLNIGGFLGLAYGGFSYTKEMHRADIGALHLNFDHRERVNIPLWAGIGAVVGGGLLLTASRKPS